MCEPPQAATKTGALAQLGEHLLCKQGVIGSIPIRSTKFAGAHLAKRIGLYVLARPWRDTLRHSRLMLE